MGRRQGGGRLPWAGEQSSSVHSSCPTPTPLPLTHAPTCPMPPRPDCAITRLHAAERLFQDIRRHEVVLLGRGQRPAAAVLPRSRLLEAALVLPDGLLP